MPSPSLRSLFSHTSTDVEETPSDARLRKLFPSSTVLQRNLLDAVQRQDLDGLAKTLKKPASTLIRELHPSSHNLPILKAVFDAQWAEALPVLVKHGQRLDLGAPYYNPDAAPGFSGFNAWFYSLKNQTPSGMSLVSPERVQAVSAEMLRLGAKVDRGYDEESPLSNGLQAWSMAVQDVDMRAYKATVRRFEQTTSQQKQHAKAVWTAFLEPLLDHAPAWNACDADGSSPLSIFAISSKLWTVPETSIFMQRALLAGADPHHVDLGQASPYQEAVACNNLAFLRLAHDWEAAQLREISKSSMSKDIAPTVARRRL